MLKKVGSQIFLSTMLGVFALVGSPVSTLGQDELCGGEVLIANGGFESPPVPAFLGFYVVPTSWSGTGSVSVSGPDNDEPSQRFQLDNTEVISSISQSISQADLPGSIVVFTVRALRGGTLTFAGQTQNFGGAGSVFVTSELTFTIPPDAPLPLNLVLSGAFGTLVDVDSVSATYTKPCPTPTNTATSIPTETPTSTATDTPTSTATDVPPTATDTPTNTATDVPPTATDTPTNTATDVPPTATDTPTETATDVPPTSTDVPPTATDVPPVSTATDVPVGTGSAIVTVVTSNGSPIPDDTEVCIADQCQSLDAIAAAAAPSGTAATFNNLAAGSYPLTVLINGVQIYADSITITAGATVEVTVVLPQGAATPSPVDPGETPPPPVVSLPSTGTGTDPSWAAYLVLLGGAALVALAGGLTWRQRQKS